MSKTRSRVFAIVLTLIAIAGLGLIATGNSRQLDASKVVLNASFDAASRARELDRIQTAVSVGGEDGRTVASEWVEDWRSVASTGGTESALLKKLATCLPDMACDPTETINSLHNGTTQSLGVGMERGKAGHRNSQRAFGLGAVLVLLATGLAGWRATASTTASPTAPDTVPDDLLAQRTEQVYSLQMQAWETDRFAAYGEISAGLSHGLKTPLASIRAAAQLAMSKQANGKDVDRELTGIIEEVDALVEQIRRFLSATGAGAARPARVSPEALVQNIDRHYAAEAKQRSITWETSSTPDLGLVLVDPPLLDIALRNLVENALAATPAGATVRVFADSVAAPERSGLENAPTNSSGPWVQIAVEDEGPGMPPELLTGAEVASTKPGGSGLGFAIARRIVSRHGGALVADPAPSGGTIIRILLPIAEATS